VAGRFRLDRLIGEGGMGVVWAATHLVTGKPVALKMLRPERAGDPDLRQRFIREARAACTVQHPNVVQIHDVLDTEDGSPVMVMDLLHGESLGQRLDRETRLSPVEVARIMLPVVSAVGTAHAAGVVHRDLKPDNIFLADEGGGSISVKVLDFGIAKVLATQTEASATGGLTGTGNMLGTPYYMAPEQIFVERDIDHRADIWALGVILYECLSGRRPTEADNIGQILKIVTTDGIVPLERVAPEVPPELARLVGRMLTRDRAGRPQSLQEVQATLRRFTDAAVRSFGDPVQRVSGASLPAAEIASAPSLPPASTTDPRPSHRFGSGDVSPTAATLASTTASTTAERLLAGKPKKRSRTLPLVMGVAVAASLATVGVVQWQRSAGAPTPSSAPLSPPSVALAAPSAAPAVMSAAPGVTSPPAPSAVASAPAPAKTAASRVPLPARTGAPAATPATAKPPPAATTAPIGGVVEKPPF